MYLCHQHVVECEEVIRELQENQESLSDRLAQQKQQVLELCGTSYILDPEFVNLQDTKDRVRSTLCLLHYNKSTHTTTTYCKSASKCVLPVCIYMLVFTYVVCMNGMYNFFKYCTEVQI